MRACCSKSTSERTSERAFALRDVEFSMSWRGTQVGRRKRLGKSTPRWRCCDCCVGKEVCGGSTFWLPRPDAARRKKWSIAGFGNRSSATESYGCLNWRCELRDKWRSPAGTPGARAGLAEAVKQALLRVDCCLEDFRRRYPSQISVGWRRVLIAMAVMHSPFLLIADEPTSALDALTQVEILSC